MDNFFKVTRLFTGEDGHSHFGEMTVPLKDNGDIGSLSDQLPVKSIVFRKVTASYDYDFHNAPNVQFLVLLDGEIEIETSKGEVRQFRAGDVLLLEDTNGKGHRTKNIKAAERQSIFILL